MAEFDASPPPPPIDITNCEREPIHIPGAILPHGAMLVLDPDSLEVLQAAGNTTGLLGAPISDLLKGSAATLFRPEQVASLRALVATTDLAKPRHLLDPLLRIVPDLPLDASLHRSGGSLVLSSRPPTPPTLSPPTPSPGSTKWSRDWSRRRHCRRSARWPPNGCAPSRGMTGS